MKRYSLAKFTQGEFEDQLLIELLSGDGKAGDLFLRILERLQVSQLSGIAFDVAIFSLIGQEKIGGINSELGILSLTLRGLKCAQAQREVLFGYFCHETNSDQAEHFWRMQLIRKPP